MTCRPGPAASATQSHLALTWVSAFAVTFGSPAATSTPVPRGCASSAGASITIVASSTAVCSGQSSPSSAAASGPSGASRPSAWAPGVATITKRASIVEATGGEPGSSARGASVTDQTGSDPFLRTLFLRTLLLFLGPCAHGRRAHGRRARGREPADAGVGHDLDAVVVEIGDQGPDEPRHAAAQAADGRTGRRLRPQRRDRA